MQLSRGLVQKPFSDCIWMEHMPTPQLLNSGQLKVTVAKCWAGLGKLVKFIGQPAVDAVYGIEKRDVEPALGVFKDCEGLMPD